MNPITLSLFIAAAAVLGLSGFYLLRIPRPWPVRIILFSLRLLVVLFLLAVFIQPVFHIMQINHGNDGPAILIDNSRSMQLFNGASAVSRLEKMIETASKGTHKNGAPSVFIFGDSLRIAPPPYQTSFNDQHSYLPNAVKSRIRSRLSRILLVSDGNWSNARIPAQALDGIECGYLLLPPIHPRPFLQVSADPVRLQTPVHTPAISRLTIQGFTGKRQQISVTGFVQSARISTGTIAVDSGYISDTVSVQLPAPVSGRRLIRIRVAASADSTQAECFVLDDVVPDTFSIRVIAPRPSLDSRFFILAVLRDPLWKEALLQNPADAIVSFIPAAESAGQVSGLKSGGVILSLGSVPCPSPPRLLPAISGTLIAAEENGSNLRLPEAGQLPPATIVRCEKTGFTTLMSAAVSTPAIDTLPVLYSGTISGHAGIFLAVQGFWRWDFATRAFGDSSAPESPFSSYLLSLVRARLISNLSSRLIVFPLSMPLVESQRSVFAVTVPAAITDPVAAHFACSFTREEDHLTIDTAMQITVSSLSECMVTMPILQVGRHAVACTLRTPRYSFTYMDSISVEEDKSELSVLGQNINLLSQVGRPIESSDSAIADFLFTSRMIAQKTERRTIQIRQSWYLLILLLLLLAGEWMLRRRFMLD